MAEERQPSSPRFSIYILHLHQTSRAMIHLIYSPQVKRKKTPACCCRSRISWLCKEGLHPALTSVFQHDSPANVVVHVVVCI